MLVRRLLYCCLFFVVAAYFTGVANACTSAIVSGKCTPDGRPLLGKTAIQALCRTLSTG